jgi:molybdopterin-containing oxidoreductase family membrane subunit
MFTAWYSGAEGEQTAFTRRILNGPYVWAFWVMFFCNVVFIQFLWVKKIRCNPLALWVIALLANVGMWFERFVIIITSLANEPNVPSNEGMFTPTWVDIGMLIGSFGLFFTMFLLFTRFLPMVAMAEVKSIMPQAHAGHVGKTYEDVEVDESQTGDYRVP